MPLSSTENTTSLTGQDVESTLLKVHLLRRQDAFDDARSILEEALVLWPQNDEIKALLLQTEKDQLAARRAQNKPGDRAGLADEPHQLLVLGIAGVLLGALVLCFLLIPTVRYMVHHGLNATYAVYPRYPGGGYHGTPSYVPAHTFLTFAVLAFAGCVWMVVHAVRSYYE
jgi:hypothetical protein